MLDGDVCLETSIVVCQIEDVVVFMVEKEENSVELVGAITLALRKGGCFGEGIRISLSLAVNI